MRRFYFAKVFDLDRYEDFVSATDGDGKVLSRRSTAEYATRWTMVRAVNTKEARAKYAAGEGTDFT